MKRVLLIEDNLQQVEYIKRLFKENLPAVKLLDCQTWEDSLVLLSKDYFDLIILDMGLPDANGLDVIANINAANAVPIMVLTGAFDPTLERRARILDVRDYVTKDISDESLISLLKSTLIDYNL